MTVTRTLDSSVTGSKSSDFSSMLQKHWGSIRTVEINREPNTSLGISIVGGKVDIHTSTTSPESILGIFVKNVVPDSPAGRSGKLNTGDRILEVSGIDLREVNHEKAVDIIRNAPNPVIFLIQSLIPWNVDDNHENDNKSSAPISSLEKINPPEGFRSETPLSPTKSALPPEVIKPVPHLPSQGGLNNATMPEIVPKSEMKIETILKSPVDEVTTEIKVQENEKPNHLPTAIFEKPEKIDAPKVQIELSPQVFGLAKEVKPAVKIEKSTAIEKNEKARVSSESESEESEEEEDVRQLEGRTVSAKGHE
ncbi:PDZ domain-containing protein, partial [Oryctes borbonicus]